MANIHDLIKPDDVAGTIIGTHYSVGFLIYEGRQQGRKLYAATEADLLAEAVKEKMRILSDCGAVANEIFPHADEWRLKIID